MALWILAILVGLTITMLASHRVVIHAESLTRGRNIPPFFIGLTLVAIGTDLPEIANSIASCLAGHGDLNVGDSIGSAAAQVSLVLGVLPFICGTMALERVRVALVGIVTVLSLALGALLVADGFLSRTDGAVLLFTWVIATVALWRSGTDAPPHPQAEAEKAPVWPNLLRASVALVIVGAGATLAVKGFVEVAARLAVPEYLISFLATSVGTSLPELFVDVVALRRGKTSIAVGNLFGSSLVDATLSLGIGPLVAPSFVTAEFAIRGAFIALLVIAAATALLAGVGRNDRKTGIALIVIYLAIYPLIISG